jgi:hypothetical protein
MWAHSEFFLELSVGIYQALGETRTHTHKTVENYPKKSPLQFFFMDIDDVFIYMNPLMFSIP